MRDLSLHEVSQISGASVLSDLQSLAQNGVNRPEQTLSVLCLGAGAIVGGILHGWGIVLGVTAVAGWVGFDIYKAYRPQTT